MISFIFLIIFVYFFLKIFPTIYAKFIVKTPNLKKKYKAEWAFVTGSSTGLGKELAMKLAEQGINLVILSKTKNKLEQTKKEILEKYPKIEVREIVMDFELPVEQIEKEIIPKISDIEIKILINNVGYMPMREFHKQSWESIQKHVNANVTSHVKLTHIISQKLIQSKSKGAICFTASLAGFYPLPYAPIYSAAKAYLRLFASTLAIELKPHGIDIHIINPGPIRDTDFVKRTGAKTDNLGFKFLFSKLISQDDKAVAKVYFNSIGGPFMAVDSSWFAIFGRILENLFTLNGLVYSYILIRVGKLLKMDQFHYD
ncbi:short chain dehydrogenase/reductase family protein [Anaeramoeba ignava]|uniref:Short chain dehydrogenase/reductase family protein n=1 Tax=Anaeramoeba ignava TaxID=1746090 RepID=A0A9Q0LJJ4_ANAIG|nr:short chain dehydrogenase/reductase family protein [Anaeramoeba ignava]